MAHFPFFYRTEANLGLYAEAQKSFNHTVEAFARKQDEKNYTQLSMFLSKLQNKQALFLKKIEDGNINENLKNEYINGFILFSKTVNNCLNNMQDTNYHYLNYMHDPDYILIGKSGTKERFDDISVDCLSVGMIMLCISVILFAFSMPAALACLGFTLMVMAPFAAYTALDTLPKNWAIHKEDDELFDALCGAFPEETKPLESNTHQIQLVM